MHVKGIHFSFATSCWIAALLDIALYGAFRVGKYIYFVPRQGNGCFSAPAAFEEKCLFMTSPEQPAGKKPKSRKAEKEKHPVRCAIRCIAPLGENPSYSSIINFKSKLRICLQARYSQLLEGKVKGGLETDNLQIMLISNYLYIYDKFLNYYTTR